MDNSSIVSLITGFGGAIVGAFGSYLVSTKLLDKQYKNELAKKNKENEENRKTMENILKYVLKNEIDCNDRNVGYIIKKIIKRKPGENRFQFNVNDLNNGISIRQYENINLKLIEYCNEELFSDVIKLYDIFYIYKAGFDVKDMPEENLNKIIQYEDLLKSVLEKLK